MTAFSFEILPPLKGNSIYKVYDVIDRLREFNPRNINITSHHSEYVYREQADGSLRRVSVIKRPGTVAVAAAIQYRYGIPAVPHIICRGFTKEETEYALLDLNFLGITNIFLLRGDSKGIDLPKANEQHLYNDYATDLQQQVNLFNQGIGLDDTRLEGINTPFVYGMACYPEKHEEAPNMESDLRYAKMKVDNGASYLVTQMFFDNSKYYAFVEAARKAGITVPIIPGIKPIVLKSQLTVLPRIFRSDIPEPLAQELARCTTDEQVREVGVEWCTEQCRDLIANGVDALHFYTLMATESVYRVAKAIY
ncbi:MAG: methylenetetrahydrofolate reductase [Muribaculaceae bacterium]|mgnify:CR=1 FL=1|nr:methylenetetrahydrofolate reductase [Muribaculaceae bacterium]MCF0214722.1 methylenetetrahydrofolate reductase [Muribaculaceae bacterium]